MHSSKFKPQTQQVRQSKESWIARQGEHTFCTVMEKALDHSGVKEGLEFSEVIATLLPDKQLQHCEAQLHAKSQSLGCFHGDFEEAL